MIGVVKNIQIRNSVKGEYIIGTIQNATQSSNFHIWQVDENIKNTIKNGVAVRFQTYTNSKFGDKDSFEVRTISVLSEEDRDFLFNDLFRTSKIYTERHEYWLKLSKEISKEWKPLLEKIESSIFFDKFTKMYGANSKHHCYIGGLFEHSICVALCCLQMANVYSKIGVKVDKSILVLSALIHDFGKVFEYESDEDGVVLGKTLQGSLEGHISLMQRYIQTMNDLVIDDKLYHLLLSHHGLHEYGSPVVPQTIEAYILSQCDLIDSRVGGYIDAFEGNNEESKYISIFERTMFRTI